jgi:hypothetical protein
MGQAAPPDIQEAFAFGPESVADLASRVDAASAKMYAPNIWPDRPAGFKKIMLSCWVGGGARSIALALTSVRRTNWTCSFPASSFHEDALL